MGCILFQAMTHLLAMASCNAQKGTWEYAKPENIYCLLPSYTNCTSSTMIINTVQNNLQAGNQVLCLIATMHVQVSTSTQWLSKSFL